MRFLPARRAAALTVTLATTAALGLSLGVAPVQADTDDVLTVVGTADVKDSNLVAAVIEPEFEKAFPQYDLKYVSNGTGAAIAYAKTGAASAMIVHAAALENQFVADGYSLEPYGRAVFWGDYVLLGSSADPAGVLTGDSTYDIRHAFEKIAAAGAAGNAHFVSRGGTPGTTVQEHAIWAQTTGVQTCDVTQADGGGKSPSTSSGSCGSPVGNLPDWYKATGDSQSGNVRQGDACAPDSDNHNDCYVFTDRGTFQYLQSTNAISQLRMLTRPNTSGDPAVSNLLVNSFHAYGINPAKFGDSVHINTTAARTFLDWLTSPAVQAKVGAFLDKETGGDAPFQPSAAPKLTVTQKPATSVAGGRSITVRGTLVNVVPGTPALNGVRVKLLARPAAAPAASPTVVATGTTATTGAFSISYAPRASQIYSVAVDDITKIEVPSLSPVFGDILQGTSSDAGATKVVGKVRLTKASALRRHKLRVRGTVLPTAVGSNAKVLVYAARPGHALKLRKTKRLAAGAKRYDVTLKLAKGVWRYRIRYVNPRVIEQYTTVSRKVRLR